MTTTTAEPGARTITADLMARLERHYIPPNRPLPGGVFLPEVGWNGAGGTSRADALYVGFTAASGRLLVGHEVKASRSDWLTELSKPGKADGWADQCHAWYLVTVPGVVHPGELPDGWGLMIPGRARTRMQVITEPRVHRDRTPSWDATRSIMARLDTLQGGARERIRDEERARVAKQLDEHAAAIEFTRQGAAGEVKTLRERLGRIEKALGGIHVVDFDEGARGSQVTIPELADLAELLTHHRNLRSAAATLASPYSADLSRIRRVVDDLDDALTKAREGLPATARAGSAW